MGPRLAILAGSVVVALSEGTAAADNKKLARDLFELGIEEYKTKQYAAAAKSMGKSYELDPQPTSLYALAQAERLSDNCKDANVHYKKVLEESKDEKIKKAIEANIELCAQILAGEKPVDKPETTAEQEQRDAPVIQTRTVYRTRTEKTTDKLNIALFAVGGTAIGGAVVTYILALSARSDADNAATLEQYNERFDRSQTMKLIAYGSGLVGIGLLTWATIRVVGGKPQTETSAASSVALTPTSGGSMISWSGRW